MKKHTLQNQIISFFLALLLLLPLCSGVRAEDTALEGAEQAFSETESPESAAAEAGPETERDDWETRLLLMLQEKNADPATIAAGYYNFVTGEEHYYNGDEYRVSGSMYKVPLNMLYMDWIDEGKITIDESIYGYRYKDLLSGTIIDSRNDYAQTLWTYAGNTLENAPGTPYHRYRILIAPYMGEDPDNVDDKYYENNFFTPRQMIHCLRTLYDGGEKYRPLVETMQKAEPEKYFKLRERRFNIAHKYGWFAEDPILYLNDCALCFTDDPIAIVLFTTGTENAYGVLTDFCTLMCDYAQETHARRVAEEEAAAAALEAEQARLAQEAAVAARDEGSEAAGAAVPELGGETAGQSGQTGNALPNGSVETEEQKKAALDALRQLDMGQLLVLLVIVILLLAAIIWFVIRKRSSRRLKLGYALLAVLLTALAMLMCLPGMREMSYIAADGEDAGKTVERLFQSLKSGNTDAVNACFLNSPDLGLLTESADETHRAAFTALQRSWIWTPVGSCSVQRERAWQEIQLQVLDFSRMRQDLQQETRSQLLELSGERDRTQIYDESGNYRAEVASEAYDRAMARLLNQPEVYYSSVGLQVELFLTRDGWKVVPTPELLNALSGNW